eukprot:1566548-Amphidinium_carterae.2
MFCCCPVWRNWDRNPSGSPSLLQGLALGEHAGMCTGPLTQVLVEREAPRKNCLRFSVGVPLWFCDGADITWLMCNLSCPRSSA